MKANRKTMLIAALAVAVIALAGIGYAAYGYTAKTTNSGNEISTSYNTIVLKNNAGSAPLYTNFMKNVELDTETVWTGSAEEIEYKFHTMDGIFNKDGSTYTKLDSGTANAAQVSDPLKVIVDPTNNGGAGDLFLRVTDEFQVTGLTFLVVVDTNVYTMTSLKVAEGSEINVGHFGADATTTFTVTVFAYVDGVSFDMDGATLDGVDFKFVAKQGSA